MCGIVGVLRFDGKPVERSEIEPLNRSIIYRGPDEEGYHLDGDAALAMRRLSIIDLSSGSQPMYTPDRRYVIVFNGEIYNYREIKAELEKTGYRFRTTSDTEVILAGYATWGKDVLKRMNGMWGLAIFDSLERKLFISRDRLGKKQLYYAATKDYFIVGSEMKLPMSYGSENRKLRLEALPEYLTYSYVGGPETALSNVKLLPEAHCAEIRSDGSITVEPYWRIGDVRYETPPTEDAAAEEIYKLLTDSVRLRLVADVPIAVMLSSGLDSSSLAYILSHELGHKLRAFSLGYSDDDFDESNDAGELARRLELPWEKRIVSGKEVRECFPRFIGHIDSLQGNTAQLVYYFVSEMIRGAGFKVALNGSGGDELFAGYPTYRANELFRYYRLIPAPIRKGIHSLALKMPSKFERVSFDYKVKKFTEVETSSILKAHSSWRTIFSKDALREIMGRNLNGHTPPFTRIYDDAFTDFLRFPNEITGILHADLKAWLIPMLPWTDNITMAHSIELRLPFLDYRLVDRALSLPQEYLFRGWELKRLMKRFLKGRLPDDVLYRKKRGTHLPLSKWLNTDLRDVADHYLSDGVLNKEGLFNPAAVKRYADEHHAQKADHTFKLWNLIMFSAWKEQNRIAA